MQTFEAMALRRSIRKFRPEPVPGDVLTKIVEISRLYPTGGNLQPVRFAIVTKQELTDTLFADLRWAMYLPDFTIEKWKAFMRTKTHFDHLCGCNVYDLLPNVLANSSVNLV